MLEPKYPDDYYKINGLFFNSPITFANSSYNNHPDIWVPTSSGTTGTICVSQGATSAPQFKTVAQALGVDFWTGTQDEYDAITAKSATTLYIIIPPAE